jgi:wyosine [tRNA(Phe)-imidazoG37] synthetase (radical SAM superfamily)
MAQHLFGPVPSRRLGVSLGIDLTPDKACSLNCVYCECGSTARLTADRAEYAPTAEVIAELDAYLAGGPRLDSITFSGSGEPTLHSGLGAIIAHLKDRHPRYAVTVLTNSTLLGRADVRSELARADRVIPSLDAVSEAAFLRINRPHRSLTSAGLIAGLETFCAGFRGEIWLEIFIVPGVNDTPEELELFRATIARLRVDRVQLNTLDRPGAVAWIRPASVEYLEHVARQLGPAVEVVASRRRHAAVDADASAGAEAGHGADAGHAAETGRGDATARDLILATVAVRPSTIVELAALLDRPADTIGHLLDALIDEGRVTPVRSPAGITYTASL